MSEREIRCYDTDALVLVPEGMDFDVITLPVGPESEFQPAIRSGNKVVIPGGTTAQIVAGSETLKVKVWLERPGRTPGASVSLGEDKAHLISPRKEGPVRNRVFTPQGIEIIYGEGIKSNYSSY